MLSSEEEEEFCPNCCDTMQLVFVILCLFGDDRCLN